MAPPEQRSSAAEWEVSEALFSREQQGSLFIYNLIIFPWNWEIVLSDLGNSTGNVPKGGEPLTHCKQT